MTWAFTFPGKPFFAGYRELATSGIAKPVLIAFRMLGRLVGERLFATSEGSLPLQSILADGVTAAPDVDLIATRDSDGLTTLVWNYHDDDRPETGAVGVDLAVQAFATGNMPAGMDATHSNAHALWLSQGAPQPPDDVLLSRLRDAAALKLIEPERDLPAVDGRLDLAFDLPRHAMSLVELRPAGPA